MAHGVSILVFFALTVVGQALTPSSYFTTVDQKRLRSIFEAAQPYTELASAHYSILGLTLLGSPIPKPEDACSFIKSKMDTKSVEMMFHASSASKMLPNCKIAGDGAKQMLTDAIKEDAAVVTIYFAFFALKNLGLAADSQAVHKALQGALKKDDGPLSYGYAFHIASELSGVDTKKYFDAIEDIVAQSDEVDEKFLQFEGGLFTTSVTVNGAYKLAEKSKKAPVIAADKVIKFTNYFLSRKHVHQLRAASNLLAVTKTLSDNKFHIPVAVTLASQVSISTKAPKVQVRVTNLLGSSLGKLTVTADSARHSGTDAVVLNKKQFTASSSDNTLYELNFMDTKASRGFYKMTISATPAKADSRLIGTAGAEVLVKVTTQVMIENVEIGVADKDQSSAAKTTKLQHPNKAANILEADHHQKVIAKFQLKDKTSGALMTAHQTFVRLTNQKTKQEVIFTASADSVKNYKFNLDIGASGNTFGWLSGRYTVELIVGDAVIENPFSWHVADISLTFPEGAAPVKPNDKMYAMRPEIEHMFRPPEKTPPTVVSNAFTVLVLLPILILLFLWMKIGVNISNFPLSVSAVGFHVCLGGIFTLYYGYWTCLDMFTTLRYLGIIGIPTFIFGNRLLHNIASARKSQK
ncbi:dolichyl-diphosphooligosaccharide--protein glycosyltransferase subunit 2-like [Lineus longissimus]|uniref:dolichyl-diphosphooligosaccharide--protein glycosyltransferase subunit 2-like n=1 Tax=Lineus longissimus TaxID=88925 RepID=UPI002B4DC768